MKCIVKNCKNTPKRFQKGVSYHHLPKCGELKKKWLKLIGLGEQDVISRNAIVCSVHFEKHYFMPQRKENQRRSLRKSAIPTLFMDVSTCRFNVDENNQENTCPNINQTEISYHTEKNMVGCSEHNPISQGVYPTSIDDAENIIGANFEVSSHVEEDPFYSLKLLRDVANDADHIIGANFEVFSDVEDSFYALKNQDYLPTTDVVPELMISETNKDSYNREYIEPTKKQLKKITLKQVMASSGADRSTSSENELEKEKLRVLRRKYSKLAKQNKNLRQTVMRQKRKIGLINSSINRLVMVEEVSSDDFSIDEEVYKVDEPTNMYDEDFFGYPIILSEFSINVIEYIAGFIVGYLFRKLKCEDCCKLIQQCNSYKSLINLKNRGGLLTPSPSVLKICKYSEAVLKRELAITDYKNITQLQSNSKLFKKISYNVLHNLINVNIFNDEDLYSHSQEHVNLLAHSIIEKYYDIRLNYFCKQRSYKLTKRNKFISLLHFKGM